VFTPLASALPRSKLLYEEILPNPAARKITPVFRHFMSDLKDIGRGQGNSQGENSHNGPRPYWKHAHRSWRIWFCVILMLVAMVIYLMTGDLRWRFHGQPQQPQQPISAPAGN
jgi:hypothetical protein